MTDYERIETEEDSRSSKENIPPKPMPEIKSNRIMFIESGSQSTDTLSDSTGSYPAVPKMIHDTTRDDLEGTLINNRYTLLKRFGSGTWSVVYKAKDTYTGKPVAIKILKRSPDDEEDPGHEERMYRLLVAGSNPSIHLFAEFLDSCVYNRHHCLVIEALCGPSLHDIIYLKSELHPLSQRHMREIAAQLVEGVAYMHSLNIVHGDLKPDNIMLRFSSTVDVENMVSASNFKHKVELYSTRLCIIDLGMAQEIVDGGHGMVANVAYRAPEVTLGFQWDFGVDVFATGCILAELYLGRRLFALTNDVRERMACLEHVLGPFPSAFARMADNKWPGLFSFTSRPRVNFPEPKDTMEGRQVPRPPVRRIMTLRHLATQLLEPIFFDLCKRMTWLDPRRRSRMGRLKSHPYFVDQPERVRVM